MKKILLFLLCLYSISHIKASDTLTVRQVYNFNVGDTFDYAEQITNYDIGRFCINYTRVVINQKYVSAAQDTFIYNGNWVITKLDSTAIYQVDSTPSSIVIFLDTTTYSGRNSNHITSNNIDGGYGYILTEGLGQTYYGISMADNSGAQTNTDVKEMIYYSNGTSSFGTPYYIADGQNLIHYIPLPESCAVWSMLSTGPPPTSDSLYEQIKTGNIIDTFGYHFVEMIYRAYDKYSQQYTPDSLLGYFINDTTGGIHAVYFTQTITQSFTFQNSLYSFDFIGGTQIGTNYVTITVDTIGGIPRTNWSCPQAVLPNPPYEPDYLYNDFMEGIGSERGLINVQIPYGIPFYTSSLISLCVCGNIIYPDTTSGQSCTLLTGINNIGLAASISVIVGPNPTSDQLHLSISDIDQSNVQFILTDVLGQEVYSSPVTQNETTHDISKLSSGIYTWRVVENNSIIKTGKVVKQ